MVMWVDGDVHDKGEYDDVVEEKNDDEERILSR